MTINVKYQPNTQTVEVRIKGLYGAASALIASMGEQLNDYLWQKTVELSKEAPYANMSKRYALKEAAEEIAEGLKPAESKSFLDFALNKWRRESNYAGD